MKNRIKVPTKTRALLQKEISSSCPVLDCRNDDVGHFEIHHIDANPSNNEFENLLLICPTCHSKIEKGDISIRAVKELKSRLTLNAAKIELHRITVDSTKCSWSPHMSIANSFYLNENSSNSPFPIFEFHLINHSNRTLVLQDVFLKVKHLYSGLAGLPTPRRVPKSPLNRIIVNYEKDTHSIEDFNPVQIPSDHAYIFRIEVMEKGLENEFLTFDSRHVLSFAFDFSSNMTLTVPKILLNTKDEDETVKIYRLG